MFPKWCDERLGEAWMKKLLDDLGVTVDDLPSVVEREAELIYTMAMGQRLTVKPFFADAIFRELMTSTSQKDSTANGKITLTPLIQKMFFPSGELNGQRVHVLPTGGSSVPNFGQRRQAFVVPEPYQNRDNRTISFLGDAIKVAENDVQYFTRCSVDGQEFEVGQDVLVFPEPGRHFLGSRDAELWVTKLVELRKEPTGEFPEVARIRWYYFPPDTAHGQIAEKDYTELINSDHFDDIPVGSFCHPAVIYDTEQDMINATKGTGWNAFFCCSKTTNLDDIHARSYVPSKNQADPRPCYKEGEIYAFKPKNDMGTQCEVFEITSIDDSSKVAMGRRFVLLRKLDACLGEPNEFVQMQEEEEIEGFFDRLEHPVLIEFLQGNLKREELPSHLQMRGAGAVGFFRRTLDPVTKEITLCPPETWASLSAKYPTLAADSPELPLFELYCGVGGSSLGLDLSGATVSKWALDIDERVLQTNAANRVHQQEPLFTFAEDASKGLRKAHSGCADYPRPGQVGVLFAGCPCQGFSILNRQPDCAKSQRDKAQLPVTLSWVDYLKPKYVIIENVFHLSKQQGEECGGKVVPRVLQALRIMGYTNIRIFALSGLQHGLAQHRDRLCAQSDDLEDARRLDGVKPMAHSLFPQTTIWDVIGGLPEIGENGEIPFYQDPLHRTEPMAASMLHKARHIKVGENINNLLGRVDAQNRPLIDGKFTKRDRGSDVRRYAETDYVETLITKGSYKAGLHPRENRAFSVRERALLQGFPPGFKFCGTLKEMNRAIGNAVPPPFGFALGISLRIAWEMANWEPSDDCDTMESETVEAMVDDGTDIDMGDRLEYESNGDLTGESEEGEMSEDGESEEEEMFEDGKRVWVEVPMRNRRMRRYQTPVDSAADAVREEMGDHATDVEFIDLTGDSEDEEQVPKTEEDTVDLTAEHLWSAGAMEGKGFRRSQTPFDCATERNGWLDQPDGVCLILD
ncbi:uroporphyrin-III C-methyltransferase [Borealophlyctis nickersoniae]|nr:uroporphyrin-III C-methyltransferase [Borealophlyctis nickersoniae]